jgi:hypothetical protein
MTKIENVCNYLKIYLKYHFCNSDCLVQIELKGLNLVYDNGGTEKTYDEEMKDFENDTLNQLKDFLEILVDIKNQEVEEIKKIQKQFRISRYNPKYKMCRNVEKKIWESCSK